MALASPPYATISCLNKSLRFFKNGSDTVNAWVAHEDLINALGMPEFATRIPGNSGAIFGCLPGSIFSDTNNTSNIATTMPVLVSGVGNLNCILATVATTIAANSPAIGVAAQTLRDAVVTAIATGAAALS